ncbi:hypothetical protein JTT01_10270 [Clostridium botulinum]|nr:hypothetical protein [Clostridium botulinum]MCS4516419.1 hypothetical protein [Clostridium botulinum]
MVIKPKYYEASILKRA